MKGLMVKDLLLMKNQVRTLLLLVLCGAVMSISFEPQAVIFYLTVMGGMVAVGTLSFDEADKGYSYLLTLPVTRKGYVREKYLFTALWTAGCAVIGAAVCLLLSLAAGKPVSLEDICLSLLFALLGVSLMTGLMIPFRLKYGSEKGRTVLYAVMILFAVGFILLQRMSGSQMPAWTADLNRPVSLAVLLLVCSLLFLFSERVSEGIMTKKEF